MEAAGKREEIKHWQLKIPATTANGMFKQFQNQEDVIKQPHLLLQFISFVLPPELLQGRFVLSTSTLQSVLVCVPVRASVGS